MPKADPQVEAKIREAIADGATDKLRALATQFPDSFEALRDADLVDLAVHHRKPGPALYLILHHGFEVSPMFEYHQRAFLGELFAAGVNQYHTTLEVMVSAALNFGHENGRSLACYALRHYNQQIAEGQRAAPTHPEFVRAMANGDLQRFTENMLQDERYAMCGSRHSVTMLADLATHHDRLQVYGQAVRREAEGHFRDGGQRR